MAVTEREPDVQTFNPRMPDLRSLPADAILYTYDRPTDTLFVDFFGEARPAASVPLDHGDYDFLFLRIDPETDAVVGLQIEHFTSYALVQNPGLSVTLDGAALVGINRDALDLPRTPDSRDSIATASKFAIIAELARALV